MKLSLTLPAALLMATAPTVLAQQPWSKQSVDGPVQKQPSAPSHTAERVNTKDIPHPARASFAIAELMKAVDKDKDGKLSKQELDTHLQAFLKAKGADWIENSLLKAPQILPVPPVEIDPNDENDFGEDWKEKKAPKKEQKKRVAIATKTSKS